MTVLDVQHLQKAFGTQIVLTDVSFQVGDGEKVGLVGRNGSGKTTVLEIISGALHADAGTVVCSRGSTIGHLHQEFRVQRGTSVYEDALSVFSDLLGLEQEIAELTRAISQQGDQPSRQAVAKLTALQEQYEFRGGYRFRSQTKAVLSGLGFGEDRLVQEATTLSGGEKTRLNLAKLLLTEPDLLLLDEPTNNLDVESVEWLESFLAKYKKSVLVVSHDRYFLDRVVTKIVEIDSGESSSYPGNYTRFVELKREAFAQKLKEWELQQRDVARRQEIIDRFMQYGLNFHKKAKSKAKLLSKIERVEKPQEHDSVHIRLEAQRSGDQVLIAEGLSKSFGDRVVLRGVGLRLMRGERVALVGPNGAGKSTLLNILAGKIKPDSGEVRYGTGVELSLYDQEWRDLPADQDVITSFLDAVDMTPGEARNLLASFLFRGDDIYKSVSDLSGGEQSRLRLATVVARKPNLVLLDEPTNHLDIASIEALEAALADFDGTLLFVSHDRYFIDKMALRVVELADGQLVDFHGGYRYYLEKRAERLGSSSDTVKVDRGGEGRTTNSSYEAQKALRSKRAELARVQERLADAEQRISEMERAVERLTAELSDPSVFGDPARSLAAAERLSEAEQTLQALLEEWESLAETKERTEEAVQQMECCLKD